MHEISLVQNILSTLRSEFPNDMDKLIAIHLTVGELSNIQPTLIKNAFQAVLLEEPTLQQNMQLEVKVLPIIIHCDDCNVDSQVQRYKFICQQCGKSSHNVIQGEEMLISKVEFAEK